MILPRTPSHVTRICAASVVLVLGCAYAVGQQDGAGSSANPPVSQNLRASGTSVALLVDTSSADPDETHDTLKTSVDKFVRKLPPGQEACLYTLSDKPVLAQDITDNHHDLTSALDRMPSGGASAVLAGLQAAAEHLRTQANEHLAIVLFTAAREMQEPKLEEAITTLTKGRNVEVDAIAGPESDWQLQEQLERIATKTGGVALFPSKEGDMPKIAEVVARKLSPEGDAGASAATTADTVPRTGPASYTTVVVRRVPVADNQDTTEFESGDDELLQKLLIAQLQHEKVFSYVLDGHAEGTQVNTPPETGRALELVASIVQYRRGNHTQRRLMGFVGGAKVKVNVMLKDMASGRPVGAFITQGSSSSGKFAGSNDEVQSSALKEVAENIVTEIKKYKKRE